ncbi:MAG: hypothetical protein A3I12_04755 [Gammaproteobacteria bacterium RIFCSPLOWO2_02_FULL_38_11]|nr:MAG: hypothetical protein A2W47_00405 [Gammaproteobacteria bacterium RIFCSPHIGHO2_12_38_15]OGT68257.1 MAG: hypothetical protein A3I12_04755 [Gammaproteobacteria bacterium RIFCSPLOWO2_02_FULL_38_11]OGT77476.1 MAG: hypothetical protein A3G71_05290 [Gammaproteobacteria bacterium RIFCSPLOWO2_12_FULL_38_14]
MMRNPYKTLTQMLKNCSSNGKAPRELLFPDIAPMKYLQVAKTPPGFTEGEWTVQRVNPEEFARSQGFEWCHNITIPQLLANAVNSAQNREYLEKILDADFDVAGEGRDYRQFAGVRSEELTLQEIRSFQAWQEQFVLCPLKEGDKDLGWGLFLSSDAKPIPAGTMIGIYGGAYKAQKLDLNDTSYSFTLPAHPFFMRNKMPSDQTHDLLVDPNRDCPRVDARKSGGLFRFLNHFPDAMYLQMNKEELSFFPFSIKTANVEVRFSLYHGLFVPVFITLNEIRPGEQLGLDYGPVYFVNSLKKNPKARCFYFDKKSHIHEFPYEKEFLLDLRCYLSFMSIRYSAVNEIASRIRITCLREMFNHRASEERALSVYSFLREKVLPELKKLKPEQEEEKWFYQALKRLCVRFACFYKEAKSQHKVAASSSEEVASASSASSSSSSYNQKSHMRK